MKNKLFVGVASVFILNSAYAMQSELDVFRIKNSYLVYSLNQSGQVYSWLKLAGDDSQGDAASGGCDMLFSGIKNNHIVEGKTLNYETDISQSQMINNVVAYKGNKSISFNTNKIFNQCGMNIVYGDFIKVNKQSKYYDQGIKEVLEDNLYDVKNNKHPNSDAYSNLINNLSCTAILNNIVNVNDIGYFLEQQNYLNDANKILKRVIACSPTRTVAYLNLGDTLNKQSKGKEAQFYYDAYKKMMMKQGLSEKIPKRLLKNKE